MKVCLQQNLKTVKIKKTDVIKVSSDEVAFNQSFNFKVDIEAMKEMGIAIQVVEATNMLDRGAKKTLDPLHVINYKTSH